MARADRLERIDTLRGEHEAAYRVALVAALETTARGTWGLFDHKPDRHARAKIAPVIAVLCDTAAEIDALRDQLGLPPFALHAAFLASRGAVTSNQVGEPRQAQAWLDRLARDPAPPSA